MKKIICLLFAVLSMFSYITTSAQSYKIFIKALDQNEVILDGGSTVPGRLKEIEALSYSNALSGCPPSYTCGGGACPCVPKLSDFSFYMIFNAAAITAKQMMLSNLHLKSVDVYYRRSTQTFDFYKIHMEDVAITSVQESGSDGGGSSPDVTVSFAPAKIAWQFTAANSNGAPGAKTTGGWNLVTNAPWLFF